MLVMLAKSPVSVSLLDYSATEDDINLVQIPGHSSR